MFSPESSINRTTLAGAKSLEELIAAANGFDVGALGALPTPAEIAEAIEKFGNDPEFDSYVNSRVPVPAPVDLGERVLVSLAILYLCYLRRLIFRPKRNWTRFEAVIAKVRRLFWSCMRTRVTLMPLHLVWLQA